MGADPTSFDDFVNHIRSIRSTGPELAADVLHAINSYFYQKNSRNSESFSEFSAFWENWHEQVLSLAIDRDACKRVATILEHEWAAGRFTHLKDRVDVVGVSPRRIANVRFFTTVQDFKVNIHKAPLNHYKDVESALFDAARIAADPLLPYTILTYLGAQGSQTEKRVEWMRNQSRFLLDRYNGDAYNMGQSHNFDAASIKLGLMSEPGMGFRDKKSDMFLRDMTEIGVWEYKSGIEHINVASDTNTMRVAIRAGLITGRFPLVSSLLDIYCYQYELVDQLTQTAWREVWKAWGAANPKTQPKTPASIDYMVYRGIGKTFCTKTAKCKKAPGCPLDSHCEQSSRKLQPPKSISIRGMTGWVSATSDEGGGLGLSS